MSAWIPVIGTLAGVAMGGIVSILASKMQFERERRWQCDRLIQEKLLEITELAEGVQRKFAKFYADAICAVESGQNLKPGGSDQIPLARLKILINFYAPELRPNIRQIMSIRDEVSPFVAEALLAQNRNQTERQHLNLQFVQAIKRINDECDQLTEAAARLAQNRLGISE